jgi:hypothetical protein
MVTNFPKHLWAAMFSDTAQTRRKPYCQRVFLLVRDDELV